MPYNWEGNRSSDRLVHTGSRHWEGIRAFSWGKPMAHFLYTILAYYFIVPDTSAEIMQNLAVVCVVLKAAVLNEVGLWCAAGSTPGAGRHPLHPPSQPIRRMQ